MMMMMMMTSWTFVWRAKLDMKREESKNAIERGKVPTRTRERVTCTCVAADTTYLLTIPSMYKSSNRAPV